MIYAIEAQGSLGACDRNGHRHGLIKFGKAKNPENRIKELSTGSPYPLMLAASMDWPDEFERVIHDAFKDLRGNGEWFRPDDYVKSFVSTMMCHHGASDGEKYDACLRLLVDRSQGRYCDGTCRAPDKRYIWDGSEYVLSEAWP